MSHVQIKLRYFYQRLSALDALWIGHVKSITLQNGTLGTNNIVLFLGNCPAGTHREITAHESLVWLW